MGMSASASSGKRRGLIDVSELSRGEMVDGRKGEDEEGEGGEEWRIERRGRGEEEGMTPGRYGELPSVTLHFNHFTISVS